MSGTRDRFQRVEEIFHRVAELGPEQRASYLDEACAGDATLRADVERLLHRADQQTSGDQLRERIGATLTVDSAHELRDGRQIGPYRLRDKLGEGGFGIVYFANQQSPVRRDVALKVIKPGMDSKQILARFDAEKQALALMNHPNVAKVLDAGTTDDGRPYFVMEHVTGVAITDYCRANRLSVDRRLDLFVQSCEAVQHAHQKGIIHRDLKPSNILVSTSGGSPTPIVIDFGIAKALGVELTDDTFRTEYGQVIGTPAYMSPEQARGSSRDIDTRSDVYSLGVVLYELLVGQPPLDLRDVSFFEAQRLIQETDPPRPSARLGTFGESGREVADAWSTDVRSLHRKLRGDLDWIVMKCLDKDRARRYESASQLAEDVRRHLRGEPVLAGPPGASYRFGKFVRRHRLGVASASAIVVALLVGIAGTVLGLLSAVDARVEAQNRADELALVVDFQAEQLGGVDVSLMGSRLRQSLLDETRAALTRAVEDPSVVDREVERLAKLVAETNFTDVALATLEENIFASALRTVDERFSDQPAVQAQLFQTLANTLRAVGLLDEAQSPQRRALEIRRQTLGPDHPTTLESVVEEGRLLEAEGRYDESEAAYTSALAGLRRQLAEDDVRTLETISSLASLREQQARFDEAETLHREALAGYLRLLGPDATETLASRNNVGMAMYMQGDLEGAEPYCVESLAALRRIVGDENPLTLASIGRLGDLRYEQGRFAEVEELYFEAMNGYRRVFGDEHPATIRAINNVGFILQDQGKVEQAEPFTREALEANRRVMGRDHPDTLASVANMGILLLLQNRIDEAEVYFREDLAASRRTLGNDHPDTLVSIANLGTLLQKAGRLDEAEPFLIEYLEGTLRALGEEHRDTLNAMHSLGVLLQQQGEYREAETYLLRAYELHASVLGTDHPETLMAANALGNTLLRLERFAEADALIRDVLPTFEAKLGPGDWRVAASRHLRGDALFRQDRFEEAESMLLAAYASCNQVPALRRIELLPRVMRTLVDLYEETERPDKVLEWETRLEEFRDGSS